MKTWQEWLTREHKDLDRIMSSINAKRLNMQLEASCGLLTLSGKIDEGEDLSDLIYRSQILMFLANEAEWIYIDGRRHFQASPRMITWGLNVLERKDEDAFLRVVNALSSIKEWQYWQRITIEFDKPEFLALIHNFGGQIEA